MAQVLECRGLGLGQRPEDWSRSGGGAALTAHTTGLWASITPYPARGAGFQGALLTPGTCCSGCCAQHGGKGRQGNGGFSEREGTEVDSPVAMLA